MSDIERLQEIKKNLLRGDYVRLAELSRVNRSVLSVYLKYCDTTVLKPHILENIFDGYEKFKNLYR